MIYWLEGLASHHVAMTSLVVDSNPAHDNMQDSHRAFQLEIQLVFFYGLVSHPLCSIPVIP